MKLLFFLLLTSITFSQDDAGHKILKNLQDKFDKTYNFSVEFKQTTNGKALLTGKFLFMKEDKLRIEFKNSVLVSDGITNWSYNKKDNKVIISKNDESSASPFSLKKIIYDYPKECAISSEMGNSNQILVLIPNSNSSIGYNSIKIWLTDDNLVNRMEMKDKADNLILIEFIKYKVNQKISDSKFTFTPPQGSKVIDLR